MKDILKEIKIAMQMAYYDFKTYAKRNKSLAFKIGAVATTVITPIVLVACGPTQDAGEQETPSGDVAQSGEEISSGEQTPSGDQQLPSGDETLPSGDQAEAPDEEKDPDRKLLPGDEGYAYPTTLAEIEASEDSVILKQYLTNYIDENLKENLVSRGFGSATIDNTETIAYDIDVESKGINALFKTNLENKIVVYFSTNGVTEEEINLSKIIDFQAKKERELLGADELAQPQFLNVDIRATSKGFNISLSTNENKYQADAQRVYEYLTGEKHEDAIYFAEVVSSIAGFSGGLWPVIRTTVMYREGNVFKIKYTAVLAKDYNSIGTENEKEYEPNGEDVEYTFGTDTTIYIEDIAN